MVLEVLGGRRLGDIGLTGRRIGRVWLMGGEAMGNSGWWQGHDVRLTQPVDIFQSKQRAVSSALEAWREIAGKGPCCGIVYYCA